MIINLLPPDAKAAVHREYRSRYLVLLFLSLTFVVGIGIVVSLPYTLNLIFDYRSLRAEAEKPEPKLSDEELAQIQQVESFSKTVAVLDPKKDTPTSRLFSEYITLILKERTPSVSIATINAEGGGEKQQKFFLTGTARNREELVSFSRRLTGNKIFTSVDLPISNLSKKENINFSITVTIIAPK